MTTVSAFRTKSVMTMFPKNDSHVQLLETSGIIPCNPFTMTDETALMSVLEIITEVTGDEDAPVLSDPFLSFEDLLLSPVLKELLTRMPESRAPSAINMVVRVFYKMTRLLDDPRTQSNTGEYDRERKRAVAVILHTMVENRGGEVMKRALRSDESFWVSLKKLVLHLERFIGMKRVVRFMNENEHTSKTMYKAIFVCLLEIDRVDVLRMFSKVNQAIALRYVNVHANEILIAASKANSKRSVLWMIKSGVSLVILANELLSSDKPHILKTIVDWTFQAEDIPRVPVDVKQLIEYCIENEEDGRGLYRRYIYGRFDMCEMVDWELFAPTLLLSDVGSDVRYHTIKMAREFYNAGLLKIQPGDFTKVLNVCLKEAEEDAVRLLREELFLNDQLAEDGRIPWDRESFNSTVCSGSRDMCRLVLGKRVGKEPRQKIIKHLYFFIGEDPERFEYLRDILTQVDGVVMERNSLGDSLEYLSPSVRTKYDALFAEHARKFI